MKRILAVILATLFVFGSAVAEVDLSSMSYEELIVLQSKLVFEIMSRPEWKEVRVPMGQWRVGEDIPAGKYCIKVDNPQSVIFYVWGSEANDYATNGGMILMQVVEQDNPIAKIELKSGWLVDIEYGDVVFTPPMSLGF